MLLPWLILLIILHFIFIIWRNHSKLFIIYLKLKLILWLLILYFKLQIILLMLLWRLLSLFNYIVILIIKIRKIILLIYILIILCNGRGFWRRSIWRILNYELLLGKSVILLKIYFHSRIVIILIQYLLLLLLIFWVVGISYN